VVLRKPKNAANFSLTIKFENEYANRARQLLSGTLELPARNENLDKFLDSIEACAEILDEISKVGVNFILYLDIYVEACFRFIP
jgi:hypothetical protein